MTVIPCLKIEVAYQLANNILRFEAKEREAKLSYTIYWNVQQNIINGFFRNRTFRRWKGQLNNLTTIHTC